MNSADELRGRTKKFGVRVVRLFNALPKRTDAQTIGKQLLRSGTSVAANYRAACRGRSKAEFVAKLGIVAEEADETVLWLEMLVDCGIVAEAKLSEITKEARELTAIFSAANYTARH